jgi:hypothetical protein
MRFLAGQSGECDMIKGEVVDQAGMSRTFAAFEASLAA